MMRSAFIAILALASSAGVAQDSASSVERGAHVAIIGGCHDCHTAGYGAANGKLDPAKALLGDALGYRGPWGTTYPSNLRLVASRMSEDEWVAHLQKLETRPPMPWFNVRQFAEADMRALYQYIRALGEPGEPAPAFVPPEQEPTTPYIVFAPPQMPAP